MLLVRSFAMVHPRQRCSIPFCSFSYINLDGNSCRRLMQRENFWRGLPWALRQRLSTASPFSASPPFRNQLVRSARVSSRISHSPLHPSSCLFACFSTCSPSQMAFMPSVRLRGSVSSASQHLFPPRTRCQPQHHDGSGPLTDFPPARLS